MLNIAIRVCAREKQVHDVFWQHTMMRVHASDMYVDTSPGALLIPEV